jgi:HPt (histidine-containing phosphotransfer) domain-containing protein
LQRALEAGCNACIRKPVRLLTLVQAVGDHLCQTPNLTGKTQVRVDARLRAVAPAYLESRRADVRTISEALERADYETIRELGHKMNGSGGAYGFPQLTEIGQALEQAGRGHDPEQIRAKVAELADYLGRVEAV